MLGETKNKKSVVEFPLHFFNTNYLYNSSRFTLFLAIPCSIAFSATAFATTYETLGSKGEGIT